MYGSRMVWAPIPGTGVVDWVNDKLAVLILKLKPEKLPRYN